MVVNSVGAEECSKGLFEKASQLVLLCLPFPSPSPRLPYLLLRTLVYLKSWLHLSIVTCVQTNRLGLGEDAVSGRS